MHDISLYSLFVGFHPFVRKLLLSLRIGIKNVIAFLVPCSGYHLRMHASRLAGSVHSIVQHSFLWRT